MIRFFIVFLHLALVVSPVYGMRIDADPRMIISFVDQSLPPELDILRVTTYISDDNHLIFRIQTKGDRITGDRNDYVLLNIQHEKTYAMIIPINKETDEPVRIFEGELLSSRPMTSIALKQSSLSGEPGEFNAKHVARGVEFGLPLDWINFGADFSFDAYTVSAAEQKQVLHIHTVYDQARRGNLSTNQVSAVTLLNAICSPKK
jgi:hypothetical protein